MVQLLLVIISPRTSSDFLPRALLFTSNSPAAAVICVTQSSLNAFYGRAPGDVPRTETSRAASGATTIHRKLPGSIAQVDSTALFRSVYRRKAMTTVHRRASVPIEFALLVGDLFSCRHSVKFVNEAPIVPPPPADVSTARRNVHRLFRLPKGLVIASHALLTAKKASIFSIVLTH